MKEDVATLADELLCDILPSRGRVTQIIAPCSREVDMLAACSHKLTQPLLRVESGFWKNYFSSPSMVFPSSTYVFVDGSMYASLYSLTVTLMQW